MTSTPYFAFNVQEFRAQFPQFSCSPPVDSVLQMYFDQAGSYVENSNYGWLNGINRALALNLLTAHIAALMASINTVPAGQAQGGVVTAAAVDDVSVTLEAPPTKNGWQYWLAQTPYGQQLWALLSVNSAGGFFVGGSATRGGFRGRGGFGVC